MPESPLIRREVDVLRTLESLAAARAKGETQTEVSYADRKENAEKTYRATRKKLDDEHAAEVQAARSSHLKRRSALAAHFDGSIEQTQTEFAASKKKVAARRRAVVENARQKQEETRWQALAVYESGKEDAVRAAKARQDELTLASELLHTIRAADEAYLKPLRRYWTGAAAALDDASLACEEPVARFKETVEALDADIETLAKIKLPGFLRPSSYVWPFLFAGVAVFLPLFLFVNPIAGVAAGLVTPIALGAGLRPMLVAKARRVVAEKYAPFRAKLAEAEGLERISTAWSKAEFERRKTEIEEKRDADVREAGRRQTQAHDEAKTTHDRDLAELEATFPARLDELKTRRESELRTLDDAAAARMIEIETRFQADSAKLEHKNREICDEIERDHQAAWDRVTSEWRDGLKRLGEESDAINAECRSYFLDWSRPDVDVNAWSPPDKAPPAMRFGNFTIDLADFPDGIPRAESLKAFGPTRFDLPALLDFPARGSILLKSTGEARVEATKLIQAVMLRYLTSTPAGKVRFTIIDPVGLGENFAAFMHLADYNELFVTSRIWTETQHIEQRLADLSAHMENVIQKYLRNEFNTIEEYNVFAGEVSEAYRILVVANFPVNFNEAAARRLVNIVSSGARCGVFTLMSVDMKQQLPSGVQLKDLEPHCLNLTAREGRFHWRDADLGRFPLALDQPPAPEFYSPIMHRAGTSARDAHRVEVPFEVIAPKPEEFWTTDSARGVDIPLGRAGATKLQHLRLGKGTSQHVLIAGKTGSGKSTLLHAMITNAALRYSPDQLELYLIDFKKGVEFKTYASHELPHARVVAVESEREFGLSVLQRLDVELKQRGDRFRDLGVQDLGGYRGIPNQPAMPRILLIVDEFQEFFVEDDKLAQDAALLFDRLVRQGRAFGIHVILGSQTLGGAFSLARSTLGQMAVRVALQCSEADAHLILSEENSAARLLNRPGEAIYNDANGMVEGNNFFQVVWLGDERRERYLGAITDLETKSGRTAAPQIVFEGNLPADIRKNHLLNAFIDAVEKPAAPKSTTAWLGDAIAIKDPTSAIFRPQSGANLLIVGQNDLGALGILTTAVLSVASQHPAAVATTNGAPDHADGNGSGTQVNGLRFYLCDGTPADSTLADRLARLPAILPHPVKMVGWRDLGASLLEIARTVRARIADASIETTPVFLVVHDLQRFRDLRKAEDDYSFGRSSDDDEPPKPAALFTEIIRDGPPVGVHTIIWCDSLNNLNRSLDRQTLREFELRVLFQMSANDSSTLIDNPAAGKLGPNRALFHSEEEGKLEKFRPYGLPDDAWLDEVRAKLARPQAAPVS